MLLCVLEAAPGMIQRSNEVQAKAGSLAALGFLVGENFHPLFGGNIDVPAYLAFQETPLQTFWQAVVRSDQISSEGSLETI